MEPNKKKALIAVAALAAAAVSICGYLILSTAQRNAFIETDEPYEGTVGYTYRMEETVLLDTAEDEKGEFGNVASFDWQGTMELTVLDARVFESPAAAGVEDVDLFQSLQKAYPEAELRFVLFEVEMKNIDADYRDESKHRLISFIRLVIGGSAYNSDGIPFEIVYFDGTMPGATAKQKLFYSLDKGETKTFKVGYVVSADDIGKDSCLLLGGNPGAAKYKILLDLEETGL